VSPSDKRVVWLRGQVKSPPFSPAGRLEAGHLLRRLRKSDALGMPQSRPMPVIGPRGHELRVRATDVNWRIVYRVDPDAIVILEVFSKKSRTTPKSTIDACRRRLKEYDRAERQEAAAGSEGLEGQ
jgi:phage-related protein